MSESKKDDSGNCTGRRDFLKSLLGLSATPVKNITKATQKSIASFYWADLKTGQIGFPTGLAVEHGQPGSIMKLITSICLSEEGKSEIGFECTGAITLDGCKYICIKPHGQVSLTEALGQSCNVYFAQATRGLNAENILRYANLMGMDRAVAGYASAQLPEHEPETVQSVALGLANNLSFHALQILQLAAIIAMRGSIPVLHSAEEPAVNIQPFRVNISDHTWSVLQQGMRLACRVGTLHKLDVSDHLKIAAKTGTTTHGKSFQSWIAGYFPYDSPRYAFCLRAKTGTSQEAIPFAQRYLFDTEWP